MSEAARSDGLTRFLTLGCGSEGSMVRMSHSPVSRMRCAQVAAVCLWMAAGASRAHAQSIGVALKPESFGWP